MAGIRSRIRQNTGEPSARSPAFWRMRLRSMVMVMFMIVVVRMIMEVAMIILAETTHVTVVSLLRLANGCRKPRELNTILAQLTIHVGTSVDCFLGAFAKDIEQQRMDIEVARINDLRAGMLVTKGLGDQVDPFFQNAGEEKERKHNDTAETHALASLQGLGQQRCRHANVAGGAPAKAHSFPQNAGQFLDIRVGVRIAAAPTDDHEQRIAPIVRPRLTLSFLDAQATQLNDLGVQV